MSDEPENSSWWNLGKAVQSNIGGSVNSLWSKAKETGTYVYEFTAHDLKEVTESLKQDVIVPSATALKHQLQPHAQYGSLTDSVTTMLGNVSEYLAPPPPQESVYLSRYGEDRICAIQTSQDTYLQHKVDEDYTEWSSSFILDDYTHEISQLLVDNVKLRVLHTALVPSEISYSNFWKIYYYRTHLFNEEKRNHEAILERAGKEQIEEEELKWSDDDEEEENVEENKEENVEENKEENVEENKEDNVEGEQKENAKENVENAEKVEKETVTEQNISDKTCTNNTPEDTLNTAAEAESDVQKVDVTKVPVLPLPTEPTALDTDSMSSSVMLSEVVDPVDQKTEVSSDGSYEVVKHKDVIEESTAGNPQHSKEDDEEFEKELDKMIENINVEETMSDEDKWEDWE